MLLVKGIALIFAVTICCIVSVRNIKRNFLPTVSSHLELFLSAVPVGVLFMLLLIPNTRDALVFGTVAAVVIGLGLSFSLPRQWRYWNVPRLSKKSE
jgi:ABC-type nitrate/sulfonate/bicarbonate transport system permease component